MTKTDQNKVIAQWMGWTGIGVSDCGTSGVSGHKSRYSASQCVPDYTSDLNAIHSAEDHLKDDECRAYVDALENIDGPYLLSRYGLVHATARQRAEALLRALSLWEDE